MKSTYYLKHIPIFLVFLIIPLLLNAQFFGSTDLDGDYYQLRVKNIEDFINRFNYTQDARGNTIKYADSLKNDRAKMIFFLFSNEIIYQNYRKDTTTKDTLKFKKNIISDFINDVSLDTTPVFLKFIDARWVAEAVCAVKYNGKPDSIKLFLSLVYDKRIQGVKWVIDSCVAQCLDISPKDTIGISPVSHNMNFMDIGKASDFYPEKIAGFAFNNYKPDYLSILFFAIKQKILKIDFVKSITFHFEQVPGYSFSVINYNTASAHSGWLISDIKKKNY